MIELVKKLKARQKGLVGGSAITFVSSVLNLGLSAIVSIVGARGLGPSEFGKLAFFVSVASLVVLFSDVLGVRFATTLVLAKDEREFDRKTAASSLFFYSLIVALTVAPIVGFVPIARKALFLGLDDPQWKWQIAAIIFGVVIYSNFRCLMVAERNFILLAFVDLLRGASYAVLLVLLIHGFGRELAVETAIAYIASMWIVAGLTLVRGLADGLSKPSIAFLKHCLHVGLRAAIVNLLGFLNLRADQYLIQGILGPAQLGQYNVAFTIGQLITMIPSVIGSVLFPVIASETSKSRAGEKTKKVLGIVGTSAAAISILMIPIAKPLIVFAYGAKFAPAGEALPFLLPGIAFLSVLMLLNNHLGGIGYPPLLLVSLFVGLVINVALNLFLLNRFGIVGAAVASSVSYGVQCALAWIAFRQSLTKDSE